MSKTNCIIIDDEPKSADIIAEYLSRNASFEVKKVFFSSLEGLEYINNHKVDLVFLDIHMPNLSGLDLLKTVSDAPKVILISAYAKYAIEGFDLHVVDYLLKPVSFNRFMKAINKFLKYYQNPEVPTYSAGIHKDFINLKEGKKFHRIYYKDIVYIEGKYEYIQIHLTESTIMLKYSLAALDNELPDNLFIRIHRSFIIAIDKTTSFTASKLYLGEKEFPIGNSYKTKVLKILTEHS